MRSRCCLRRTHNRAAQVIEKAYKKLRLDALVIQQGRLTENTKTVNKDDLLSMVRYGAEMVFSSSVRACGARRGRAPAERRRVLSTGGVFLLNKRLR